MRWALLIIFLFVWAITLPQALQPEADLPPCHVLLLGVLTILAFAGHAILRGVRRQDARRNDQMPRRRGFPVEPAAPLESFGGSASRATISHPAPAGRPPSSP